MFFSPITNLEVENEIRKLKIKSTPGLDDISSYDLKLTLEVITPILTDNFNDSLTKGEFPDCLKNTVITPIFKEGDKNKCNNYRPISLLPTIGKVFEK